MSRISPQGNWLHCVAEDSHLYCFEMVRSATYIYTYPALCSARPPLTGACRTQPQGKLEHLLKAHAYTHVRAHTCIRICTHAHAHAHAHRRRASWSTCSRLMTRTSLASPSILIAISSPRGQTRGHSSCGAPPKAISSRSRRHMGRRGDTQAVALLLKRSPRDLVATWADEGTLKLWRPF